MKSKIYLILIVNTLALSSFGQEEQAAENILRISGTVLLNDQPTGNYAVSIYLDGTMVDSLYTKSKKVINFHIGYNKVYTFLFQKVNCFDKIVIVNTQIPDGITSVKNNTFDFAVEMSQALTKKREDLIDYPVAVLLINKNDEILEASAEYNNLTHENSDELKNEPTKKKFLKGK